MAASTKRFSKDQVSVFAVILVTFLALALGWGVKTSTENRSRSVEYDGISASIPMGWLVQDGVGDVAFTARDPMTGERYIINFLETDGDSFSFLAAQRAQSRLLFAETFRILDETPVTVRGVDGYKVTYAYVDDPGEGGLPTVIKGVEYYFQEAGGVVVISFEVPVTAFDDAFEQFARFRDSVSVSEGE